MSCPTDGWRHGRTTSTAERGIQLTDGSGKSAGTKAEISQKGKENDEMENLKSEENGEMERSW